MEIKEQILSKSAELFMRYGIKSVTMDDIARELGVSKKTLYQFVENKSDLIQQIFQQKAEAEKQMMAHFRRISRDAIEEILLITEFVLQELRQLSPTTVYDLQKYYRNTWKMMETLHRQHIYQLIRDNLERGILQEVYRRDVDPDIIAKLYVASSSIVTNEDWFPIRDYRLDFLFLEHMNYHLHGIASPKGVALLEKHLARLFQRPREEG